jgi:tetratricopeptide (TPR) repeat protein
MTSLEEAILLRKKGKFVESNKMILELLKQNPDDAQLNYQCAWSFDIMEEETKAVSYYEKAIELGLPKQDKKEAYLGLGSTYRCIGEYDKAIELFEKAILEFNDNSLKVFYAMALYNKLEYAKSMEILLKIIAGTSKDASIETYKKAIEFYSDKLDKKFN